MLNSIFKPGCPLEMKDQIAIRDRQITMKQNQYSHLKGQLTRMRNGIVFSEQTREIILQIEKIEAKHPRKGAVAKNKNTKKGRGVLIPMKAKPPMKAKTTMKAKGRS